MTILEKTLVPQIEKQNLVCIPRVRIGNLGRLDLDYHISKRSICASDSEILCKKVLNNPSVDLFLIA